ncbi:MAG TPA: tetratricopeptide repeat protein, partial [bacterium]|nr:tetratricopeptide repeat protein [bacterium]
PERPALPNLKEIVAPTIVMVGECDIPDVHAHAGAIEAGIPGAQRYVIRNAGHLVPLEQPAVFNEQVGLLLRQAGFCRIIATQGVAAGVKAFGDARAKDPEVQLFSETRINQMGYEQLAKGSVDDAIELFNLAAAAYPQSWNVYDSLGEAYARKGDRELAIKNYEKSLELNPDNANGKRVLQQLKGQ